MPRNWRAIDQQCSVASHLRQLDRLAAIIYPRSTRPPDPPPMFEANGDKCGRKAAASATEDDGLTWPSEAERQNKGRREIPRGVRK